MGTAAKSRFPPQWSKCRCVLITNATSRGIASGSYCGENCSSSSGVESIRPVSTSMRPSGCSITCRKPGQRSPSTSTSPYRTALTSSSFVASGAAEQRVAVAEERRPVDEGGDLLREELALLGDHAVDQLGRRQIAVRTEAGAFRGSDRRELDHLAGDERRNALVGGRLRELAGPLLVAERSTPVDRVSAEKEQRCPLELGRRGRVLDELDLEPCSAQLVGDGPAFLLWARDRADHAFGWRAQKRFANCRRGRVREDDCVGEPVLELDRDRGGCTAGAVDP